MSTALSKTDLLTRLKSEASALGIKIKEEGDDKLSGEMETIGAKWLLGGRKVSYKTSCRLTDADHTVHFREAVLERSWGIPPLTFTVETTSTKGWERSGSRTDRSAGGGGGHVDYAQVREKLKETATAAGWQFHLEGGRLPA